MVNLLSDRQGWQNNSHEILLYYKQIKIYPNESIKSMPLANRNEYAFDSSITF